ASESTACGVPTQEVGVGHGARAARGGRDMNGMAISGLVFAFMLGAALLGFLLRRILPEQHRSSESKEGVIRGLGHIVTMAAVVLSLPIASAKNSYDTQTSEITQLAANVGFLDRVLPPSAVEHKEPRVDLRGWVAGATDEMGQKTLPPPPERAPALTPADDLYDRIQALSPASESQRTLRA